MNDSTLAEFLSVDAQIKALETRRKELRDEILDSGQINSERYLVSITEVSQSRMESMKNIQSKSPKLMAALVEFACIKEIKFKKLKITKK